MEEKETIISLIKDSIESCKESAKKYDKDGSTYYADRVKKQEAELLVVEAMDKDDNFEEYYEDYEVRYNYPSQGCPICQFETLMDGDLSQYMLKKFEVSMEDMKSELKGKFQNYPELKKYLNDE